MKLDNDEQVGISILVKALEEPMRQIITNAGLEGAVIVNKVRENDKFSYGFNARTEKYEDLISTGVIDPTKVTITALQNAASVAGMLLTTECVITDKPEEKGAGPAMPPMDPGMMGGMGGMGGMM